MERDRKGKRAAFLTLGCKVNQEETASLQQLFRQRGYRIVGWRDEAEVYIINTCTVTHLADRKSRQMIRRATVHHPESVVAVVGCYAQVNPKEILGIEGVDLVVGTQQRGRLVELVEEASASKRAGAGSPGLNAVRPLRSGLPFEPLPLPYQRVRTRAFLKIEEGCDQFCTYCIVPFARGPVRSLPPEEVERMLLQLVEQGYREIVLTGVHTSAYGRDQGGIDLVGLLRRLNDLPGEFRIRLSSVEPADIGDRLLELMASSSRFCRHLHIPLQSGGDQTLRRMHRPYTTADYRSLFERAVGRIPGLAIAADVMVGFPGESDADFEESYQFIASLPFRDLHVFKYSPRPGTAAAAYPEQVAPQVKEERSKRLLALAEQLSAKFAGKFVGERLELLVERRAPVLPGYWEGLSDNYLRVYFPEPEGDPRLRGRLVPVMVKAKGEGDTLIGEVGGIADAAEV